MTRAIQNRVKPTTVSRTARSRSVVPRKAARSSAASVTPSSRGEQGVQANPGSTCCHSKDSSENGSEPLCNRRPSSFTPKDTDPMNLTSEPDIKFQPASFKPKAGTKTGKPATITAPCVIGTTEANENSTKGQGIVVTAEEKPTLSIRTAGLKIRKEYIAVANDMPLIKQTKGTTVHNQLAKQIMTTDKKSKATGNPVAITTPYESISENGPAESTSKNSKNAVGFSASNSRKEISTNSYFFSESPESSVNSLYNAADYVRSKPTSLLPFIASPSTEIISPRSAGARPRQAFSPFGCPQANLITNNYPGSLHAPVVCPQSWAPYSQDCPHGYQLLSQYGAGTYVSSSGISLAPNSALTKPCPPSAAGSTQQVDKHEGVWELPGGRFVKRVDGWNGGLAVVHPSGLWQFEPLCKFHLFIPNVGVVPFQLR